MGAGTCNCPWRTCSYAPIDDYKWPCNLILHCIMNTVPHNCIHRHSIAHSSPEILDIQVAGVVNTNIKALPTSLKEHQRVLAQKDWSSCLWRALHMCLWQCTCTYLKVVVKLYFPVSLPVVVEPFEMYHQHWGKGLDARPLQGVSLCGKYPIFNIGIIQVSHLGSLGMRLYPSKLINFLCKKCYFRNFAGLENYSFTITN